jgi:hypothetical protein
MCCEKVQVQMQIHLQLRLDDVVVVVCLYDLSYFYNKWSV